MSQPAGCTATVTVDGAVLRSGPGSTFSVMDKVPEGAALPVRGRSAAAQPGLSTGWYLVMVDGNEAWIAGRNVKVTGSCAQIPVLEPDPAGYEETETVGMDAVSSAAGDFYPTEQMTEQAAPVRDSADGPLLRRIEKAAEPDDDGPRRRRRTAAETEAEPAEAPASEADPPPDSAAQTAAPGVTVGENVKIGGDTLVTEAPPPEEPSPTEAAAQVRYEIAVRALTDRPSEVDLLGFGDYADALVDFIANEHTRMPLTIGINASWGMGKTTLMGMIEKRLRAHTRRFLTVTFNAWKYDDQEVLWAALVLEILRQVRGAFPWWRRIWFGVKLNWSRLEKSQFFLNLLRPIAVGAGLFLFGMVVWFIANLGLGRELSGLTLEAAQVVGSVSGITAAYLLGKRIWDGLASPFDLNITRYIRTPDYQARVGFLASFERDFKRVVGLVTQRGQRPLVVFIDDLDRCAPSRSSEIIEALNILVDSEYCVFVLGMDVHMVAASIESKYKGMKDALAEIDDPGGLTLGQRFLEKIVQISFHIPRIEGEQAAAFIDRILGREPGAAGGDPEPAQVEAAKANLKAYQQAGMSDAEAADAVANLPGQTRQAVRRAQQAIVAETFDDSDAVRTAIADAAPYLEYNPRKIKRFINLFRLQALIANRRDLLADGTITLDQLARWVVVSTRWPDVVEALLGNRAFVERLLDARHLLDLSTEDPEGHYFTQRKGDLDVYLADPRLKRLLDAADLFTLLDKLPDDNTDLLPYLHLAGLTLDAA